MAPAQYQLAPYSSPAAPSAGIPQGSGQIGALGQMLPALAATLCGGGDLLQKVGAQVHGFLHGKAAAQTQREGLGKVGVV